MKRLIEKIVFCGLVTACRLATVPTSRSPSLVNATTEGVVRPPSALGMTTGSPPSITATTELVVPRSIPITLSAIIQFSFPGAGAAPAFPQRCELARTAPARIQRQGQGRIFLPYRRTDEGLATAVCHRIP